MLQRKTPLRRSRIKARRKVDKRTPGEREYFEWLSFQPCAVSNVGWKYTERSHIRRARYGAGMGKKPSDWFCIPLWSTLHKKMHRVGDKTWEAEHGSQESFLWQTWERYGLDKIPAEIRKLATVVKEPR